MTSHNSLLKPFQIRLIKQYTTDLPQYVENTDLSSVCSHNHYLQRLHLIRTQLLPGSTQYQFDSSYHSFYSSVYTPLVSTGNITSYSNDALQPTVQSFAHTRTVQRTYRPSSSSSASSSVKQQIYTPHQSKPHHKATSSNSNSYSLHDDEIISQLHLQLMSPMLQPALFSKLKTSLDVDGREKKKEELLTLHKIYGFETGQIVSTTDRIINLDDEFIAEYLSDDDQEDPNSEKNGDVTYSASIVHRKQLLKNDLNNAFGGISSGIKRKNKQQAATEKKQFLDSIVCNVFGSALTVESTNNNTHSMGTFLNTGDTNSSLLDPTMIMTLMNNNPTPLLSLDSTPNNAATNLFPSIQLSDGHNFNHSTLPFDSLFDFCPSSTFNLFDPLTTSSTIDPLDNTLSNTEMNNDCTGYDKLNTGIKRKTPSLLDGLDDEIFDIHLDSSLQTNTFDIQHLLSTSKVYEKEDSNKIQQKKDIQKRSKDDKEMAGFLQQQGYLTEEQQKNAKRQRILDIE